MSSLLFFAFVYLSNKCYFWTFLSSVFEVGGALSFQHCAFLLLCHFSLPLNFRKTITDWRLTKNWKAGECQHWIVNNSQVLWSHPLLVMSLHLYCVAWNRFYTSCDCPEPWWFKRENTPLTSMWLKCGLGMSCRQGTWQKKWDSQIIFV